MIVGAGLVGHSLCSKFSSEGHEVILIDSDKEKLQRIEKELNILTVHGSGASAKILAEAGIAKADLFIAVTNSDETNLISCIMSREYDVKTRIARVYNEDFLTPGVSRHEESFGIDLLISPKWAMSEEVIKLIHASSAFDTAQFAKGKVMLLGYVIREDNPFVGMSLLEIGRKQNTGKYVMTAIIRDGRTIIPRGHDVIHAGDKIYLMMLKQDMPSVEKLFNLTRRLPENIFILGGGDMGYLIARQLEELGMKIKLVEQDLDRCNFLSENLSRTLVFNCDALNANCLLEEEIDLADLVIAVTESDTSNILASLLAKHHGAKRCITRITRKDFIPMLGKLGIDVALSPLQVAADMILRYVRRGKIVSIATILDSDAEVMEVKVPETKFIAGQPLKDCAWPTESNVGAIVRQNEAFIPTGDTIIQPGDNLVIFFTKAAARDIDKLFSL